MSKRLLLPYVLTIAGVAALSAPPAQAQAVETFQMVASASRFETGCLPPSPCFCPIALIGQVSGSIEFQALGPSLGPIFEYNVLNFDGLVTGNPTVPIPITGSGTVVIDVIANTQEWTLNLVVGGAPLLFTSLPNAPLSPGWFTGTLMFNVYSPQGTCEFDGLSITALGAFEFERGDCNVDNSFDISDPVYHLTYLFAGGPPIHCDDACDANDDGVLNLADAVLMLTRLFSGGAPLPAPNGGCGPDPTPDTLGCMAYAGCP